MSAEGGDIVSIRRAVEADRAAITDLATSFYATEGYTTPPEAIAGNIDIASKDINTAFFVAEHNEKGVIGFVTVLLSRGIEFGIKAELEALFVRSAVRGQRIGTRLLEAAMAWGQGQGAQEIFLVIAAQGEPVRQLEQLYLGMGFSPSRRILMHKDVH